MALVCGCKRDEVSVYTIPKPEPQPAPSNAQGMPPMFSGQAASSSVTGTPPANWQAQPLSEMRQASYLVKGSDGTTADVSLVVLPGDAGGELENINRWLSQLGKPAITDDQLAQMAQHVNSLLGDVTVVDFEGLPEGADPKKDGRIIAGIVLSGGKTCFFKMRGNSTLAELQKSAFTQWIGTVRLEGADAGSPARGSNPGVPQAIPGVSEATPGLSQPAPPAAEKPQIKWEIPPDWKPAPEKPMRYASFTVDGKNGESADISISEFDGDGGSNLENVNRWRGQAGLDPIEENGLRVLITPIVAKEGDAILTVDIAGQKSRILAGWARTGGRTWFFKLTAPDKLAAAQKAAFAKFLQSVEFHP